MLGGTHTLTFPPWERLCGLPTLWEVGLCWLQGQTPRPRGSARDLDEAGLDPRLWLGHLCFLLGSQVPLEGHVRIKGPRSCNALAGAGPGEGSRGSSPMSTNCELLSSGSRPVLPNAGPTRAPSWPHAWLRARSSLESQP